jgi:hypothetical protein
MKNYRLPESRFQDRDSNRKSQGARNLDRVGQLESSNRKSQGSRKLDSKRRMNSKALIQKNQNLPYCDASEKLTRK